MRIYGRLEVQHFSRLLSLKVGPHEAGSHKGMHTGVLNSYVYFKLTGSMF